MGRARQGGIEVAMRACLAKAQSRMVTDKQPRRGKPRREEENVLEQELETGQKMQKLTRARG